MKKRTRRRAPSLVLSAWICFSAGCGGSGAPPQIALAAKGPPYVEIQSPSDGDRIQHGEAITCRGVVSIPEGFRLFGNRPLFEIRTNRGGMNVSVYSTTMGLEECPEEGLYRFEITIDRELSRNSEYEMRVVLDMLQSLETSDGTPVFVEPISSSVRFEVVDP